MKQLKYLVLILISMFLSCSEEAIPQKFFVAAEKGKLEYLKEGVSKGYDVNAMDKFGTPAIIYATIGNKIPVVEYLIEQKANVNIVQEKTGVTALGLACKNGEYEIVEMLLAAGANPNVKDLSGKDALQWATDNQYLGIVDLINAQKK